MGIAEDTRKFRFVGLHPDTDSSGRTVEPGGFYFFSNAALEDPANSHLFENDKMLEIAESSEPDQGPKATEAAVALAKDNDVNLNDVQATGKDGSITRSDVEGHLVALADQEGDKS